MILHLPPQHVAEEAFAENDPLDESRNEYGFVVRSRIAGPSRVVFKVPVGTSPVDYRLEAILELLGTCTLAVAVNAVRGPDTAGWPGVFSWVSFYWDPPALAPPGPSETAIELPLRLILSPDEQAGFAHASRPVIDPTGHRVELWHTRLQITPGPSDGSELESGRQVRAVWMRQGDGIEWDPNNPVWPPHPQTDDSDGAQEPFALNAMKQRDRHNIVHVSGNLRYAKQTRTDFVATPVEVHRLALSSLGAWLDSCGEWDPTANNLVEWSHRATQGRDHFVRIIDKGFIYPFGHAATRTTITERKFNPVPGEPPILRTREFIIVRQRKRVYEPDEAPEPQEHAMPLRTVRFRTRVTPNLVRVTGSAGRETPDCYLIRADDSRDRSFPFSFTGTDAEGNTVDLITPLVWVSYTSCWIASTIRDAQHIYHEAQAPGLDVGGRPLAVTAGPTGDTTYTTYRVEFSAPPSPGPPDDQLPGFWPELVTADIRAPALALVAGLDEMVTVAYPEVYRTRGFVENNSDVDQLVETNRHAVIAQLVDPLSLRFDEESGAPIFDRPASLDLSFAGKGERSGGLIQPNMTITGLSRNLGPVGGPVDSAGVGIFDPTAFFGDTAKLFGVLPLGGVIKGYERDAPAADMPRLVTEGAADSLRAVYMWTPTLQSFPDEHPFFATKSATTMQLRVLIDARGAEPVSDVTASITNFSMNLPNLPTLLDDEDKPLTFIELHFDRIEFHAPAGRKPDISVVLGDVVFTGPLSFVEELQSLIPLDGFADPPALDVTEAGIKSNFSLALPNLAVGVFSLQNLGLSAGFAVPFLEGPLTVSFAFCTRQEPFLLTVSMFGGGGFFGITVSPEGVDELEGAFEFGASVAIDLGVAQGGVHVLAGIYFSFPSGEGATLSGYLRLGGNMSVLGLISASIELTLAFSYKPEGKATGRAELEVEIDIFLFSFSVTVECERTFAGSGSDPTFAELMAPYIDEQADTEVRPWNQYCQAYA